MRGEGPAREPRRRIACQSGPPAGPLRPARTQARRAPLASKGIVAGAELAGRDGGASHSPSWGMGAPRL